MPIAPEHRWLYPIDWPQLSRLIRFGRAKGRCERCGRPHGQAVTHMGDGRWWDEEGQAWRDGQGRRLRRLPLPEEVERRWPRPPVLPGLPEGEPSPHLPVTRVVLASAHLDHDPGNNRARNLAALCQRCHMLHDAPEHRRRRWIKAFRLRAVRDLFG